MELRSSEELLVWLAEVSRSGYSGALSHGEHLLNLAISQRKVTQPPNPLGEWLYELRESGMIGFDDSGAASVLSSGEKFSANNVFLLQRFGVTAAGRAFVKSR